MRFGFKQPLVGEKRCVTTLITAAEETTEGPVAEFSGFANFEEKKRKSNLLMSFPKIVNTIGSFGQKRKKMFFRFCRPILDIFGFTLLITATSLVLTPSTCLCRSWALY